MRGNIAVFQQHGTQRFAFRRVGLTWSNYGKRDVLNKNESSSHSTGWPNKNRTFFEIPYFCSHYRYNHAVFAEVFRNNSKKTSDSFFKMSVKYSLQTSQNMVPCNFSANRL